MQKDETNKRPYERALRKLDNIEDLILVLEEQHSNYSMNDDIKDGNMVGREGEVNDAHYPKVASTNSGCDVNIFAVAAQIV